jgi:hypothetical protein
MNAEKYATTRNCEHIKRISTLRARAALHGVVVNVIEDDRGGALYIFSRWALCRQLDSIDAAERWLDAVVGAKK